MPHTCRHTSGKTRMVDISFGHGDPKLVETEDWRDWVIERPCEYGGCVEWCCPICKTNKYGGYGSIFCPCDDTVPNHEERRKKSVPMKPSLGTNRQRRRRRR